MHDDTFPLFLRLSFSSSSSFFSSLWKSTERLRWTISENGGRWLSSVRCAVFSSDAILLVWYLHHSTISPFLFIYYTYVHFYIIFIYLYTHINISIFRHLIDDYSICYVMCVCLPSWRHCKNTFIPWTKKRRMRKQNSNRLSLLRNSGRV